MTTRIEEERGQFRVYSVRSLGGALVFYDSKTDAQSDATTPYTEMSKIKNFDNYQFYNYCFNKIYNKPC